MLLSHNDPVPPPDPSFRPIHCLNLPHHFIRIIGSLLWCQLCDAAHVPNVGVCSFCSAYIVLLPFYTHGHPAAIRRIWYFAVAIVFLNDVAVRARKLSPRCMRTRIALGRESQHYAHTHRHIVRIGQTGNSHNVIPGYRAHA